MYLRMVPSVVEDALAAVGERREEVVFVVVVEGNARDEVEPVDHANVELPLHPGFEVRLEPLVAHPWLAVRHHPGHGAQDGDSRFPVVREDRRENGGQRAAETVAGNDDPRIPVGGEEVQEGSSQDVVGGGHVDIIQVLGEATVKIFFVLESEGLEEAEVEEAELSGGDDREVDVGGPVVGIEGLRATEHQHNQVGVLPLVAEDECLRSVRFQKLCKS